MLPSTIDILGWYQQSFANDPATWIGTFVVIGLALLGAVKPLRTRAWATMKALADRVFGWHGRALEAAREDVRTEVRTEQERVRRLPRPKVRWAITRDKGGMQRWTLWNAGTETVSGVRLECDATDFRFADDAAWDVIEGRSNKPFRGVASSTASALTGINFVIEYCDAHERQWSDTVHVPPAGW